MRPTKILSAADPSAIQEAAAILRKGGLVAFPTETVYGLGADALNPLATAKIFEAKGRPSFDPLIVHVSSASGAYDLWSQDSPLARKLIEKFWPGPLTLVLPKSERIPAIVTSDLPTVAVRMPESKAALDLIEALGSPLAAPSANLFGHTSPTTAEAVREDLDGKIDLILDGGPARIGVESTVIKIENETCFLLRPGGVPVELLEKITPVGRPEGKNSLESPGLLEVHYAPWSQMTLMDREYPDFIKQLGKWRQFYDKNRLPWPRLGFLAFDKKNDNEYFDTVEVLSAKGDLCEAAANLFDSMRKLDKMNLDLMIAEPVDFKGIGRAIMDRLEKASGGCRGVEDFFEKRKEGK